MKYFALRHKFTGWYLPQKHGNAYTCHEPMHPKNCAPRLFTSKNSANCCLTWWLRGWSYIDRDNRDDYVFKTEKVPSRKRQHWEVVPVTLITRVPIKAVPKCE